MDLSIVIPLLNEDESLPKLEEWIRRVVDQEGYSYEIIMIDDGSTDDSWNVVQSLAKQNPNIKAIKFRRNYGKSAALSTGFHACQGDVVITMDADLQDSPDEIPKLYKGIRSGQHIISGWKKTRHDPIGKTIPSKLFNRVTGWISGIRLHDFNCGLKAYDQEVVKNIELSGDMHRYIPVIAKWAGFTKISEEVVQHRARQFGKSKYGAKRLITGFLDLLSITFIGKFGKRPMHLFGTLGIIFFILGLIILAYLSYQKLIYSYYGIADRPVFYFGIVLLIVGSQLFMTGFISEMVARSKQESMPYKISSTIGLPQDFS